MKFKKLRNNLNNLDCFKKAYLVDVIKNPNLIKNRPLMFIDGVDVNGMNLAYVFEYVNLKDRWRVYVFSLDKWEITFEYARPLYASELKEWYAEHFKEEGIIVKS